MNPQQILNEADRCVKCGLCLPQCPTYRLTRDEGDSPRGRVSLIQALVGGSVDSPRLHRHLDRCLGCLACETACPSGVRYGALIDAARELQPHQTGFRQRLLLNLLTRIPYLPGITGLLRAYQTTGARWLARRLGGRRFRRLDDLLPPPRPRSNRPSRRTIGPAKGRVGLFTGCIGRITDQPALLAAAQVLTALGVEVVLPKDQVCCGALHLHNGQPGRAERLAAANRSSFDGLGCEAILHVASGCGAQLANYRRLDGPLDAPVLDVCSYLSRQGLLREISLTPLGKRVLVHSPCSLRHPFGKEDSALSLLRLIPDLAVAPFPDIGCCGAAGSYLLKQPEMADALRVASLDFIGQSEPDLLLTSNTGCALHLAAGLRQSGATLPVMHPIELIARQLPSAGV